jgi:cysteine desulfurase
LIYLDHNASTFLWPEVAQALTEALQRETGNPSSVHRLGRAARSRVESARARVARVLGCEAREVVFTASGSESDALAIKGAFGARRESARTRLVCSAIEHPAVLSAVEQLEATGVPVTRVSPGAEGRVTVEALEAALGADVALCSLMWANNETGVLQPVAEISKLCRARGVVFHTDAVQAAGKVPVRLGEVDADLLSLSGHKIGAPAGVGVLVVRRGVDVTPLVAGHQENGRRGGTHNVAYIEAFALALELSSTPRDGVASISQLRDRLEAGALALPGVTVNGAGAPRLSNTSNLHFENADGEALLIALDLEGIHISAGAACASGSLKPSHVLLAMGLTPAQAHASLRFSLGHDTTEAQIDQVIAALGKYLPRAREAAQLGS